MITNQQIFKSIEKWAPKHLAYEWDPIGLQVGSKTATTKKVMITLDVIEDVVDEAIEQNVDLIIAHHPLLFNPLKIIDVDSIKGRIVQKLIKHQITVYAAHTNLDIAEGGVNDILCEALNIQNPEILKETTSETLYKVCVYVPISHQLQVQTALGEAGAGFIGAYSHCQFQTEGKGSFKPLAGTDPFIGTVDELTHVDEVKIETIAPHSLLNKIVQKMCQAHPYEEPAYDIFELRNKGKRYGLGRIGTIPESMNVLQFCEHIKEKLNLSHVRVSGNLQQQVKKVAVLGGSGEKYFEVAKRKGADVYITGDMTFHPAQDAWQMGMNVVDAGHYIEKVMKQSTKEWLQDEFNDSIEVIVSEVNTDPFQLI